MPQFEGHLCHAPVVEGVFERLGHAFVFVVCQHEPVAAETVHAEGGVARGGDEGFEGVFVVESRQTVSNGVCNHGRAVVAYHTVGLPAGEFPYGQFARFVIDGEHGPDEVHGPLGLDLGQQGMQAAESVP